MKSLEDHMKTACFCLRSGKPHRCHSEEIKEYIRGSLTSSPHAIKENSPATGNCRIGEPAGAQSESVRGEPEVTPIVEYRFVLERGETVVGSELDGEQGSRPFEWGAIHFYTFDEEGRKGVQIMG